MSFAVVADEVRSLAQRSAQAARETADKIEDSIKKSEHGVQISVNVSRGLQEIVTKARQVDELLGEVATASKEQSQGIAQVNTAVVQMDKVTQSSAAGAEESASAAEELNAQAKSLKESVARLQALVEGSSAKTFSDEIQHRPAAASSSPANPPTRTGTATAKQLSLLQSPLLAIPTARIPPERFPSPGARRQAVRWQQSPWKTISKTSIPIQDASKTKQ